MKAVVCTHVSFNIVQKYLPTTRKMAFFANLSIKSTLKYIKFYIFFSYYKNKIVEQFSSLFVTKHVQTIHNKISVRYQYKYRRRVLHILQNLSIKLM